MRKKLLAVVAICLAVLIVAVGAYAYIQILNNQKTNPKTFNFSWGGAIAEKFNATTFWMNVTFERTNDTHLTITVKTNDLNHRGGDVSIFFDENGDGKIGSLFFGENGDGCDAGKMYRSSNITYEEVYLGPYRNGHRFVEGYTSPLSFDKHECIFDPQQGYTYIIPISLEEHNLTNDLVYVGYLSVDVWETSVEFCFGMELIA